MIGGQTASVDAATHHTPLRAVNCGCIDIFQLFHELRRCIIAPLVSRVAVCKLDRIVRGERVLRRLPRLLKASPRRESTKASLLTCHDGGFQGQHFERHACCTGRGARRFCGCKRSEHERRFLIAACHACYEVELRAQLVSDNQ